MQKRIVIADDDPTMRKALHEALYAAGYETVLCPSGEEASQRIKDSGVDLVIGDVRMPGLDGLELLRRNQSRSPSPPFIMISGYATVPEAVEAMKMGAFDFLVKPFSYRELVSLVEAALRQGGRGEIEDGRRMMGDRSQSSLLGLPSSEGRGEIVTRNPRMQALLKFSAAVARSQASVLIRGESGTGKELLARYLHSRSRCRSGPFVAVNCAAVPEGLLESEMFGYERGAFTGAVCSKSGKFELAHTGTLLLDEVGEMPLGLQAKLLRVLQEREVDRLGGKKPIRIDIRIIATTNRDLHEMLSKGCFREDLFYRLNVIPLRLPPLRERIGDIEPLAQAFLSRNGYTKAALSPQALSRLEAHTWRGNIRELFNILERATILADGSTITIEDLLFEEEIGDRAESLAGQGEEESLVVGPPPVPLTGSPRQGSVEFGRYRDEESIQGCLTVRETEKQLIRKVLNDMHSNRTQAAKLLGISVRTLRNKLRQYREEA